MATQHSVSAFAILASAMLVLQGMAMQQPSTAHRIPPKATEAVAFLSTRGSMKSGAAATMAMEAGARAQAKAQAYAKAAAMGLSKEDASDMGVEWQAAGLSSSMLVGGVDTECDSGQFDSLELIDKKAKYACEAGLAGMMNWRMDNDFFEKDGNCAPGWPKPEGAGQTFKGSYKMRDAVNEYCKDRKQKPMLAAYIGFGINYDMLKDTWHARSGKPLYKTMPYDTVDRIYLAFADIKDCEFQDPPKWLHKMVHVAREKNPNLEIYLTSQTGAQQYKVDDGSGFCNSEPHSTKFTQSLLKTLDDYKLNGYDIDWEEQIDKEAHASLIEKVGKSFENTKYGLTLAVWPSFSESSYDLAPIRKHVQQVNLMSYGGSADELAYSAKGWRGGNGADDTAALDAAESALDDSSIAGDLSARYSGQEIIPVL